VQIQISLLPLHVKGLSFRCTFTGKPDTWPECGTIVDPIAPESDSEIRFTFNIFDVAGVVFLSGGLEHQDAFVGKPYMYD
jgi:hypothetical protein